MMMKKLSYLILLWVVVGISVVWAWRLRPIPKKLIKQPSVVTGSVITTGSTLATGGATSQSWSQTTIWTGVIKNPLVYMNKEYWFQLTLPKGWEEYRVFIYNFSGESINAKISITLPTKHHFWRLGVPDPKDPSNTDKYIKWYAEMFNIGIWIPEQYKKEYKRCFPNPDPSCIPILNLLWNNKNYYFTSIWLDDMPTDLYDKRWNWETQKYITPIFKFLR
jgi:hypothetical protein